MQRKSCESSSLHFRKQKYGFKTRKKLEPKHIAFLTSEKTLQSQAGYTLKTRAIMFHRKFTDRKISASCLCRLYRKHSIKRKMVRRTKLPPTMIVSRYLELTNKCRSDVRDARARNLQIVYVDETVFTKRTYATHDYGAKGKIVEVDEARIYTPYVAALAAVSVEQGIDHLCTYDGAVNGTLFAQFLQDLSRIR